jgi:hypothetical protein
MEWYFTHCYEHDYVGKKLMFATPTLPIEESAFMELSQSFICLWNTFEVRLFALPQFFYLFNLMNSVKETWLESQLLDIENVIHLRENTGESS